MGGLQPWQDYIAVARASSGAELLDHRNYGPAAQIAMALGLSESAVRLLHVVVVAVAIVASAWSAWARRDAVESLAWAAVASLVTLPVTWIHYPAALIPFVIAALARNHGAAVIVGAAAVSAVVALSIPLLLWLAVALAVLAIWVAERSGASREPRAPAPA